MATVPAYVILLCAAVVGAGGGAVWSRLESSPPAAKAADGVGPQCRAIDGDTLRCGSKRIRLLGMDAPEMGKCRKGRVCVEGDPVASKEHLARLIDGNLVELTVVGEDRYGRSLAVARAGGVNLNCAQIAGGYAEYVRRWDDGGLVARACG